MIFLWVKTRKGTPTPQRWPDDVEDVIRRDAKAVDGTERILSDSERHLSLRELAELYPCPAYLTTCDTD